MSKFGVKIGYPDKWLDYSSLAIDESDHFLSMVFKAREFENLEEAKEINAPTDKLKWFLTPQTVNAYYHVSLRLGLYNYLPWYALPISMVLSQFLCFALFLSQISMRLSFRQLFCNIHSLIKTQMML